MKSILILCPCFYNTTYAQYQLQAATTNHHATYVLKAYGSEARGV